jgi:hypothetical protein
LEGELLPESPPAPLLLHQRLHVALHHEGGVVQPPDYGFVVVTWLILSMYCNCISPYELPNMNTAL